MAVKLAPERSLPVTLAAEPVKSAPARLVELTPGRSVTDELAALPVELAPDRSVELAPDRSVELAPERSATVELAAEAVELAPAPLKSDELLAPAAEPLSNEPPLSPESLDLSA